MNAYGRIERVYVRAPDASALGSWREYGWHDEPDAAALADEHAEFVATLRSVCDDVIVGTAQVRGDPDAIYAYDPTLVTDAGVIPLRMGKPGRRDEPSVVADELRAVGCTVLSALDEPATAEGGDMFFLDDRTLLVGCGYRTNLAAVDQLRVRLADQDVEVIAFDLPHHHGASECLHLMSFISMLDADLAVGYLPMMPVRLVQLLEDRGVEIVEVPDEEFGSMGPNVLALGPRSALALAGNPVTKSRMQAAGVDVTTYTGAHVSTNGDGGPTCLTRPLVRE
jgi:N-dimethylarginine dimethylaminohydrolase